MQRLERILNGVDFFSEWSGKVVSYLLLAVIAATAFEIVSRYVFDSPTIWVYEFSLYCFGSYFMLVGAYALVHKAHVSMDLFHKRLSVRKQAILSAITSMFTFLFCSALIWQGGKFAMTSVSLLEHSVSLWGPPLYPFKLVIPVAGSMILLQALANFIRDLICVIRGTVVSGRTLAK